MSFLVDWWAERLEHEVESRRIAHLERVMSPELMAMANRPQSVINLQRLYDGSHAALRGNPWTYEQWLRASQS